MKKKFILAITAAAVSVSSVSAFAAEKENYSYSVNSFDSFAYNYLSKSGLISDDCTYLDEEFIDKIQSMGSSDDCLKILLEILNGDCGNIPQLPDIPDVPEVPEEPEIPGEPNEPEIPDVPEIPDTPEKPEEPNDGEMSSQERAFASEVVHLVNIERAKEGLNELESDSSVQAAAQVRAEETEISFSHTRPDGRSCYTALDEAGVQYSGAGENIAYGQKTPAEVVETWMNSPGHRANILNANYTNIGVGCYNSGNTYYWSQFFTY